MNKLDIYDTLNRSYFSDEMDEKEVIQHLPVLLKTAKTFVDIGASLGQYTYFANQIMNEAEIVAIEADPIRAEKLDSNCKKWAAFSTNKLRCLHGAVSDVDGGVHFFSTNSNVSGGLFKHELNHLNDEKKKNVRWTEHKVDSYTLDKLFPKTPPDCIKIDVEGSELRVLLGSQRILKMGHAIFLIEIHNWSDPKGQRNAKDVFQYLKKFGYRHYNFYGKPLFVANLWKKLPLFWFKLVLTKIFTIPKRLSVRIKKLFPV